MSKLMSSTLLLSAFVKYSEGRRDREYSFGQAFGQQNSGDIKPHALVELTTMPDWGASLRGYLPSWGPAPATKADAVEQVVNHASTSDVAQAAPTEKEQKHAQEVEDLERSYAGPWNQLLAAYYGGSLPPLPKLNIDRAAVSVSGIGAGADFAVQLQVAYSKMIAGSAIFAGQAYHCGVHYFQGEPVSTTETAGGIRGFVNSGLAYVGLTSSLQKSCENCPEGKSFYMNHCKTEPKQTTAVDFLVEYAKINADKGEIDGLTNLAAKRVYLYRAKNDNTYLDGSVDNTYNFFQKAGVPLASMKLEKEIDYIYALPGVSNKLRLMETAKHPSYWFNERGMYDGAGEALKHIYGEETLSWTRDDDTDGLLSKLVKPFNQTVYFPQDGRPTRFANEGAIFVPDKCTGQELCKLHIFLHGCGVQANQFAYMWYGGFNEWAAKNNIVVVYPQLSSTDGIGCFDSNGETGGDYDLKRGVQMMTIANMVEALVSGEAPPL